MSATPSAYDFNVHQIGLTVAWCFLLNFSILCAQLKYRKTAIIIHAILGYVIAIMTYTFVLYILAPYGFFVTIDQSGILFYIYGIIGCALLGLVVLQIAGGFIGRFCQVNQRLDIFKLRMLKGVHKYTGYFIALLFKINIIWCWDDVLWVFIFLIVYEILCLVVLFYFKVVDPKLQKSIIDRQTINSHYIRIDRIDEIRKEQAKYILFGNYVYDASDLQRQHPGGHQVIQTIMGRQVDRFLYGMYSSELFPELQPYSHSSNALKLLGSPIARIVVPSTFSGITSQIFKVQITQVQVVSSKTQIYALGLKSIQNSLTFQGYSEIRQLGQYYSLTMSNSVTRLYTAVNFLAKSNINLMNKIIKSSQFFQLPKKRMDSLLQQSQLVNIQVLETSLVDKKVQFQMEGDCYLSLMLKVYNNGQLTSALLKNNFQNIELTLSQPKGRGLQLQKTAPGRIVIVAGGTGLFPFSDLIDLAFKSQLIQARHPLSEEILQRNPLLKSKPFQKFKFVLLVAINEPQDIHPITMRQLQKLSADPSKFKVVMRVSKNQSELSGMKSGIEFTREYFTERALNQGQNKDFSRFWICGPPKMSTDTAKALLKAGFKRDSFLLV